MLNEKFNFFSANTYKGLQGRVRLGRFSFSLSMRTIVTSDGDGVLVNLFHGHSARGSSVFVLKIATIATLSYNQSDAMTSIFIEIGLCVLIYACSSKAYPKNS